MILLAPLIVWACGGRDAVPRAEMPGGSSRSAESAIPPHSAPAKVDISGYYVLNEDAPGWSSNIEVLDVQNIEMHLDSSDIRKNYVRAVPLWGFIRLKADSGTRPTDFRLVGPQLEGRRFRFTTQSVDAVSYGFAGEFVRLGDFPETCPNGEVLLTGHLRRQVHDSVINEADVRFTYSCGD